MDGVKRRGVGGSPDVAAIRAAVRARLGLPPRVDVGDAVSAVEELLPVDVGEVSAGELRRRAAAVEVLADSSSPR